MAAIGHALALAGSMTGEVLWALILGFALSALVRAVVRRSTIVRLMGDDRPRTLGTASVLGAASSSCSYAAVALARTATVVEAGISWNYTTWLNIAFLALSAVLLVRFVRTGGVRMPRAMGGAPERYS